MFNRKFAAIAGSIVMTVSMWATPGAANAQAQNVHTPSAVNIGKAQPTAATLRAAVANICSGLESGFGCQLQGQSRVGLGSGVSEYNYLLRVGPGPHDLIGLHRVVQTSRSGVPYRTPHAVMFVHGDIWGFDPAFAGKLGGPHRAPNVATWLAARGVDVWGIDLRWILVPASTQDRSFMRSWDSSMDVRDIRVATTVERGIRGLTGSGSGRTALLGWSRGGFLVYAYVNYESHLPARLRNVDALIPADTVLKFAPQFEKFRQNSCVYYRDDKQAEAEGFYAADQRVFIRLGGLALKDPTAKSPFIPSLTNRQTALLVGAGASPSFNPWYHFVAGIFNSAGIPNQLSYTPAARLFAFFRWASPFEAIGDLVDSFRVWCGKPDPLVDNLRAVHVPVLYLGAAGGFGVVGSYSPHVLGSSDISQVIVRLRPVGQEAYDFGHVDLWQASNAPQLAWAPLLSWLRSH